MTVSGLSGDSNTLLKYYNSFFTKNPAALVSTSIPTIEECALWHVPKASFTYMSPNLVNYYLKSKTAA